jgi:hypothetical protein
LEEELEEVQLLDLLQQLILVEVVEVEVDLVVEYFLPVELVVQVL